MATQVRELVSSNLDVGLEPPTETLRILTGVLFDDSFDEDFLRPSKAAFDLAWETISHLPVSLSCEFPATYCSAIGNGGLTLVWELPEREVALTVADGGGRLAHVYTRETGQAGKIVDGASAKSLADALLGVSGGG